MSNPKLIQLSDGNTIPQLGLGVWQADNDQVIKAVHLSLIHISEPTRPPVASRMPSSA